MSEAGVVTNTEANTTVATIVAKQEPSRITVVTPDNFQSYVDDQLGVKKETPEEKAAAELVKVEEEKKARKAAETDVEADVAEHLPKDKKGKLNERFSEITEKKKAAEAKAAAAEAKVTEERQAREKAEQEAAALKAKYEPVKTEQDPEPQPTQFTDVNEYAKALKEWTADNTRREDAKKAQEQRVANEHAETVKAWSARQEAARKEIPDYDKTIAESAVKVSDQVRDAILESEAGPQILHHLAKNPDVAEKIGQMRLGSALREIGKLEATLGKAEAPQKEAKTTVAEISKAPAPITPLRGANAPVANLSGTDVVPPAMDYDQWKKLRQAGKIR